MLTTYRGDVDRCVFSRCPLSVPVTRRWWLRPYILLCSLYSSLMIYSVVSGVIVGFLREIIALTSVEDVGKRCFTASCGGLLEMGSLLEMYLRQPELRVVERVVAWK